MKLKSLIMFSAAALAFAACSNDEDFNGNNGGVEGLANVSVNISDPVLSRAIPAASFTETTEVTLNTVKVVLTAQQGGDTHEYALADYENRQAMLDAIKAEEFKGVRNPSKLEVFINTDKASGWTVNDVYDKVLAEPLYDSKSASEFGTPVDTDSDGVKEYTVTLEPEHTMARLEFGGIAHVDTKEPCMFTNDITIDGVILDNVTGLTTPDGWSADYLLSAAIGEKFTEATGDAENGYTPSWPGTEKGCYAFNIIPDSNLPILKVCFSNIKINTAAAEYSGIIWPSDGLGYATVKNYKLANPSANYASLFGAGADGIIKNFPKGYIYQVKSLEIPDQAIGEGWQGNEDVHVVAIVDVKPYVIVEGTVEWN